MYKKDGNVRIIKGKKHNFLVLGLYYSTAVEIRNSMAYYMKKMVPNFPEEIKGRSTIPDEDHMLKVRIY